MRHFKQPRTHFSENYISYLLGIAPEELKNVNHSGLQEISQGDGHVLQYYIHFDKDNDAEVLKKLKVNKRGIAYFPPDMIRCTL